MPDLLAFMTREDVGSLVGSIRTRSIVARPSSADQCRQTIAYGREHGLTLCPRGSGRSYGDMALNDRQVLLDLRGMSGIEDVDLERGEVRVLAGTRLIDIFDAVHHTGWTLAASPTESHSSVAGAICANVNGKDAWRHGSFGEQVVRLSFMTADGQVHEIDRTHAWFHAIVGGLGVLGIILDATLQLRPIPSPYVRSTRIPASNVDELLMKLAEVESTSDHAVVWVDAYARGARLGRSVIHATNWIERDQTEEQRRLDVMTGIERLDAHRAFGLKLHNTINPLISLGLQVQRPAVSLFNRLYYAKSVLDSRLGRNTSEELFIKFSFEASFTVPPAHLVCGPHGYTIQLTFPRQQAREAMVELLEICQSSPCPPVTAVLRVHKRDDHWISFSEDGYSLNLEIHPKRRHIAASRAAVDRLIDATARRAGKIHLAKDQVLTSEQFARLFPQGEELSALKRQLDPDGLFASDLARRVGLCA